MCKRDKSILLKNKQNYNLNSKGGPFYWYLQFLRFASLKPRIMRENCQFLKKTAVLLFAVEDFSGT